MNSHLSFFNSLERRRLSPVAILSNSDKKYLDLINGPPDHSWCSGRRCGKRISTFMVLVASDTNYDIYFSSNPPKQLRFRILNGDASFKIKLSVYYFSSQRLDLYKNDVFITPTNAEYVSGDMVLKKPTVDNLNTLMPTIKSNVGENFYYKPDSRIYFISDAASVIDIKIAPVLFVRFGFPAITPEQFFNSDSLVSNFAALLGVAPSKIRRVEIVRASRRKRQIGSLNIINIIM